MENEMSITKEVRAELNSYETSELERYLEALEFHILYKYGLDRMSGGYAIAKACNILKGEEYDQATNSWVDLIEIEVEAGEQTDNCTDCRKTCHKIIKTDLMNKDLGMRDKISLLQEA